MCNPELCGTGASSPSFAEFGAVQCQGALTLGQSRAAPSLGSLFWFTKGVIDKKMVLTRC